MRYLLDTHTFLWWITDDERLSERARAIIADGQGVLTLSAASAWEIAIKARLGRLELANDPEELIPEHMALNHIEGLPVQVSHGVHVFSRPHHHRDPFDRLLVSPRPLEELQPFT